MANTFEFYLAQFKLALNAELNNQFRELIQHKHLYQSVRVDHKKLLDEFIKGEIPDQWQALLKSRISAFLREDIALVNETDAQHDPPYVRMVNLKLYCSSCKGKEAFACTHFQDLTRGLTYVGQRPEKLTYPLVSNLQVYAISYQCLVCKSDPICLLARKTDWRLRIEGRSPIEEVFVERFFPEEEANFMRDSLLAFQSGKTLAAVLYLRVFIERFARRQVSALDRMSGDELLDKYALTIDIKKREIMPSLKSCYERLSVAIHTGHAEEMLYQDVLSTVSSHFDLRRALAL